MIVLADSRNSLNSVGNVDIDVIADELIGILTVVGIKADRENKVAVRFRNGDAKIVDRCRQLTLGAGNSVLHVDRGNIQVIPRLEGNGDGGASIVAAAGGHVVHALNTVDGFFQRDRDRRFDFLRARSNIGRTHRDLRRRQLRIQRDGQAGDDDRAGQNNEECANGGEDRPMDKEINKHVELPLPHKIKRIHYGYVA